MEIERKNCFWNFFRLFSGWLFFVSKEILWVGLMDRLIRTRWIRNEDNMEFWGGVFYKIIHFTGKLENILQFFWQFSQIFLNQSQPPFSNTNRDFWEGKIRKVAWVINIHPSIEKSSLNFFLPFFPQPNSIFSSSRVQTISIQCLNILPLLFGFFLQFLIFLSLLCFCSFYIKIKIIIKELKQKKNSISLIDFHA